LGKGQILWIKNFIFTPQILAINNRRMNFLDKLLNREEKLVLQFGRHAYFINTIERNQNWEYAFKMFEQKRYLDACKSLLQYLKNTKGNNLSFRQPNNQRVNFRIIQGSKVIEGYATHDVFFANVRIAKINSPSPSFFKSVLEQNYFLKYTKYAIDDDNNLAIVYNVDQYEASPLKVFYALREMAFIADKNDDVWVTNFDELEEIATNHTYPVSQREKDLKWQYLKNRVAELENFYKNEELFIKKYPGAVAYKILDFAYSIDYLVKPEGNLMKIIEDILGVFYGSKIVDPAEKVVSMMEQVQHLKNLDKYDFDKELYLTVYSFGSPMFANHFRVAEVLASEIANIPWYLENQYFDTAVSIGKFSCGFLMYNYLLPSIDRTMLHLMVEVTEHQFFEKTDRDFELVNKGMPVKKKILQRLSKIIKEHQPHYQDIIFEPKEIRFDSMAWFVYTYLTAVVNMKHTKENSNITQLTI
jgi:hypothetical protein